MVVEQCWPVHVGMDTSPAQPLIVHGDGVVKGRSRVKKCCDVLQKDFCDERMAAIQRSVCGVVW